MPYDKVIQENIELSKLEERIIDLEEFRRLKSIKQNGFSYMRYPDARNNRYDHSIGVVYWADKLYGAIPPRKKTQRGIDDLKALRLAALIHDIGHGPFSHALEMLFDRNPELWYLEPWNLLREEFGRRKPHELLTLSFVKSEASKELIPSNLRGRATKILEKKSPLSLLISGDLDADRLDYLTRDSQYSGLPFGFNVKAIFNGLIRQNLDIVRIDSEWFLQIDSEAVPAFEQLLMARYAHYFYIAYEPTVLLANLVFVSELEKCLWERIEKPKKIALAVFHIFTELTDDKMLDLDFSDVDKRKRKLLDIVKNSSTSKAFESLKNSRLDRASDFIRLSYLGKAMTYNFFKAKASNIKKLEQIVSEKLERSVEIQLCLPQALTTKTCVWDEDIKEKYRPSLVYDYSPVVRALEQKMYLDCGVMISSVRPVSRDTLIEIFETVSRPKTDFDMYTYAILTYIKRVKKFFSKHEQKWKLRRSSIFEFLHDFMKFFLESGRIKKRLDFELPWYSEGIYELLQKLEFLDVLDEDFNLGGGDGFIPCYVYSSGEYAGELLELLVLKGKERREIRAFVEEYIKSGGKP